MTDAVFTSPSHWSDHMITRQWQCDVEIVVQAASKMSAADESPAF